MTEEELKFLLFSPEGESLEKRYRYYNEAALFHLLLKSRKEMKKLGEDAPPELKFLPLVVNQIRLRRQAATKFTRAEKMFFTSKGLEQASSEEVANHIAERFSPDWRVADLTAGLGGNTISLAARCKWVMAIDPDKTALTLAWANVQAYNVMGRIEFVNNSIESILEENKEILEGYDALFLDPSRQRPGKTKTRSILNSQPRILDIWEQLNSITKNIAIKISPAFDYKELELIPEKPEIELISSSNVNQAAILWFGKLKRVRKSASIIFDKHILTLQNKTTAASGGLALGVDVPEDRVLFVDGPQKYLYELNKAVTKARLIDVAALNFSLARWHHQVSLLTSDKLLEAALITESIFARVWEIEEQGEFSWSKLQKVVSKNNLYRIKVIVKNYPIKPEEVYERTGLRQGGDLFLIITVLANNKAHYILARRL